MAGKRNVKKAKAQQPDKAIQYVGIALVILVVVFFLWQYVPWESFSVNNEAPSSDVSSNVPKQYDAAPPMTIDVNKKYFATVEMEKAANL